MARSTALVTGANRGIGLEVCRQLARGGMDVILTGRSATAVAGAVRALRESGVKVNAACPGWVRTRMGGTAAPKGVEEGADTIVWLAMLPADGPSGGLFRNRQRITW